MRCLVSFLLFLSLVLSKLVPVSDDEDYVSAGRRFEPFLSDPTDPVYSTYLSHFESVLNLLYTLEHESDPDIRRHADSVEESPPLYHPFPTPSSARLAAQSDPFGWNPATFNQVPLRWGFSPPDHYNRRSIHSLASRRFGRQSDIRLKESITGTWTSLTYDIVPFPGTVRVSKYVEMDEVRVLSCGNSFVVVMVRDHERDKDKETVVKSWVPGTHLIVGLALGDGMCECEGDEGDEEEQPFRQMYAMVQYRTLIGKSDDGWIFVRFEVRKLHLHEMFLEVSSIRMHHHPGNFSKLDELWELQNQTASSSPRPRPSSIGRRGFFDFLDVKVHFKRTIPFLEINENYDKDGDRALDSDIELFHRSVEKHYDWEKGISTTEMSLFGDVRLTCSNCYFYFESGIHFEVRGGLFSGVDKCEVYVYGKLRSSLELTLIADATIEIQNTLTFVNNLKITTVSFTVFCVPVWFDIYFGLRLDTTLWWEAELRARHRFYYNADAKLGYSLSDGFIKEFNQDHNLDDKPKLATVIQSAKLKFRGRMELVPEFKIALYSVVPVVARVIPYIHLEATLDFLLWKLTVDQFYWGLVIEAGIGKFEIAGFTVWGEKTWQWDIFQHDICPGCLEDPETGEKFVFLVSSVTADASGAMFGEYDPGWNDEVPRLMKVGYSSTLTPIQGTSHLYRSDCGEYCDALRSQFANHGFRLCIETMGVPPKEVRVFVRPSAWETQIPGGNSFAQWDINDASVAGRECFSLPYSAYHSELEYLIIETNNELTPIKFELLSVAFLSRVEMGQYLPQITLSKGQNVAFYYLDIPRYEGGIVLTSHENFPMNFKVTISCFDEFENEVMNVEGTYTETSSDTSLVHVKEILLKPPMNDSCVSYDVFVLANAQNDETEFRLALTGFDIIQKSAVFNVDSSDSSTTRLWKFTTLLSPYKIYAAYEPPLAGEAIRFFTGQYAAPRGEDDPQAVTTVVEAHNVFDPYDFFLSGNEEYMMMEVPYNVREINSIEIRILYALTSGVPSNFVPSGDRYFVMDHNENTGFRLAVRVGLPCDFAFQAYTSDWIPVSPDSTDVVGSLHYYVYKDEVLSSDETYFRVSVESHECALDSATLLVFEMMQIPHAGDSVVSNIGTNEEFLYQVTQLSKAYLHITPSSDVVTKFRRWNADQEHWEFPATEDYTEAEISNIDYCGIDGTFGSNHPFGFVAVKSYSTQSVTVQALAYSDPVVNYQWEVIGDPVLDGFNLTVWVENCPPVAFSSQLFSIENSRLRLILQSVDGDLIWANILADYLADFDTLVLEGRHNELSAMLEVDFATMCAIKYIFPATVGLNGLADDSPELVTLSGSVFSFQDGRRGAVIPSVAGTRVGNPVVLQVPPTDLCPDNCNSRGSCESDGCHCNVPYSGKSCSVVICSTTDVTDAICWGNGICGIIGSGPETSCECDAGWYGDFCGDPECDSQQGTERCHHRGICTPDHTCVCDAAFYGNTCESGICNLGAIVTNGDQLTDGCLYGDCYVSDADDRYCVCDSLHTGETCSRSLCFGIDSQDEAVCSGHGTCVLPNSCECSADYNQSDCSNFNCNGYVCHGHGICLTETECLCDENWDTESMCSVPICYGTAGAAACSGHGVCVLPDECACQTGYGGITCETLECYDEIGDSRCSNGHGSCIAVDDCQCYSGWEGSECESCVEFCVHGTCVDNVTCACSSGYHGPLCSLQDCNATQLCEHGSCSSRICTCDPNYYGSLCSEPICGGLQGSDRCTGHGTCVAPNRCDCDDGYDGSSCSVLCVHGVFDDPSCECDSQWYGDGCEIPRCFGATGIDRCGGHGDCLSPDVCECWSGWSGSECESPVCGKTWGQFGCVENQGECREYYCECQSQFYGIDCSILKCNGLTVYEEGCLNAGVCVGGLCDCRYGWGGLACDSAFCRGGCGPGRCASPDRCDCSGIPFYGDHCEIPLCNGQPENFGCLHEGVCQSDHSCACMAGWGGSDCSVGMCYENCSGHGVCLSDLTCECESGWLPPFCVQKSGLSVSSVAAGFAALGTSTVIFLILTSLAFFFVGCCVARKRSLEDSPDLASGFSRFRKEGSVPISGRGNSHHEDVEMPESRESWKNPMRRTGSQRNGPSVFAEIEEGSFREGAEQSLLSMDEVDHSSRSLPRPIAGRVSESSSESPFGRSVGVLRVPPPPARPPPEPLDEETLSFKLQEDGSFVAEAVSSKRVSFNKDWKTRLAKKAPAPPHHSKQKSLRSINHDRLVGQLRGALPRSFASGSGRSYVPRGMRGEMDMDMDGIPGSFAAAVEDRTEIENPLATGEISEMVVERPAQPSELMSFSFAGGYYGVPPTLPSAPADVRKLLRRLTRRIRGREDQIADRELADIATLALMHERREQRRAPAPPSKGASRRLSRADVWKLVDRALQNEDEEEES